MKKIFKNIYIYIGIITILLIISSTYAYWQWVSTDFTNITINIDTVKITYVKGPDINNALLKPTATKSDGIKKEIKVSLNRESNTIPIINFYLDIIELSDDLKHETFKYEFYKNDIQLIEGDFSGYSNGSIINLILNENLMTIEDKYTLYIWINGNVDNPISMSGKPFTFKLRADGHHATYEEGEYYTSTSCFTWSETSTESTISKYNCYDGNSLGLPTITDIKIPEKLNNKPVVRILNGASNNPTFRGVKEIEFPHTLKTINDYAFSNNTANTYKNEIANLTLPSNLTSIGQYAFQNNRLNGKLIIPKNVTTIGNYAFTSATSGTNQLTNLVFEKDSKLQTIGISAFDDNKITGNLTIPSSVTSIGINAFNGNKITNLFFESNSKLQTIGSKAFYYNGILGTIIIPNSVITIDNNAFNNNKITQLLFEKDSKLKTIKESAFSYNNINNALEIPLSVTTIEPRAFNSNQVPEEQAFIYKRNLDGTEDKTVLIGYAGIKKPLIIPESVKIIDTSAVYGISLSSVTIPEGVITINNSAFANNCFSFSINIPASVTFIGDSAFSPGSSGCVITNIIFANNSQLETIGKNAFNNHNVTTLTIPSNVTSIGQNAFTKTFDKNYKLTKIINKTGRAFPWCDPSVGIIETTNCNPVGDFVSGTLTIPSKTVEITLE